MDLCAPTLTHLFIYVDCCMITVMVPGSIVGTWFLEMPSHKVISKTLRYPTTFWSEKEPETRLNVCRWGNDIKFTISAASSQFASLFLHESDGACLGAIPIKPLKGRQRRHSMTLAIRRSRSCIHVQSTWTSWPSGSLKSPQSALG